MGRSVGRNHSAQWLCTKMRPRLLLDMRPTHECVKTCKGGSSRQGRCPALLHHRLGTPPHHLPHCARQQLSAVGGPQQQLHLHVVQRAAHIKVSLRHVPALWREKEGQHMA